MAEEPYKAIQLAVDSLLGTKTTVRRKKRTLSDRKKEMFVSIITLMEETIVRSNLAYQELQLDLFKFEDKYVQIIDMLMFMNFGEDAIDAISFYLYDRLNDDGSINPIHDPAGQEIILENPYQLWDLVVFVNPKVNEG
jgi:hypothetical protein